MIAPKGWHYYRKIKRTRVSPEGVILFREKIVNKKP